MAAAGDLAGALALLPADARDPDLEPGDAALAADLWHHAGRLDQAAAFLAEAVERWPDQPDLRARLAALLPAEEGIAEARLALALDPGHPRAHRALGHALLATGRAAQALPHLEVAAATWADDPAAQATLGLAEVRCGREEAGWQRIGYALAGQPWSAELAALARGAGGLGMGRVLFRVATWAHEDGDLAKAMGLFELAAQVMEQALGPGHPEGLAAELRARVVQAELGQAEAAAQGLAELVPRLAASGESLLAADARLRLAALHVEAGRGREARAVLAAVSRADLDPGRVQSLALLEGWVALSEGDLGAAADGALALLAEPEPAPDLPFLLLRVAELAHQQGDPALAGQLAQAVVTGGWRDPVPGGEACLLLGRLALDRGDTREGRRWLLDAVRQLEAALGGDDPRTLAAVGMLSRTPP